MDCMCRLQAWLKLSIVYLLMGAEASRAMFAIRKGTVIIVMINVYRFSWLMPMMVRLCTIVIRNVIVFIRKKDPNVAMRTPRAGTKKQSNTMASA